MDGSRSRFSGGVSTRQPAPYDFNMPVEPAGVLPQTRRRTVRGEILAGDGARTTPSCSAAETCTRADEARTGDWGCRPSAERRAHPRSGVTRDRRRRRRRGGSTAAPSPDPREAYVWGYGDLASSARPGQSDAMTAVPLAKTKKMEGDKISALSFEGNTPRYLLALGHQRARRRARADASLRGVNTSK